MTNDNCPVELKDRIQCYGLATGADGPGAGISKQGCVAEMRSLDQEKQVCDGVVDCDNAADENVYHRYHTWIFGKYVNSTRPNEFVMVSMFAGMAYDS